MITRADLPSLGRFLFVLFCHSWVQIFCLCPAVSKWVSGRLSYNFSSLRGCWKGHRKDGSWIHTKVNKIPREWGYGGRGGPCKHSATDQCGHWGSQEESVSRLRLLTQKNEKKGLRRGLRGSMGKSKPGPLQYSTSLKDLRRVSEFSVCSVY